MRILKPTILLLSILFFVNCRHYTKETRCFNEALGQYNIVIPDDSHSFIIIPTFSCAGCVKMTWLWLEHNMSGNAYNNISIIDCNINDDFVTETNCDVYFDTLGVMDNLCFDLANPMIIKTDNRRISSITYIDPRFIEETLQQQLLQ